MAIIYPVRRSDEAILDRFTIGKRAQNARPDVLGHHDTFFIAAVI